MCFRKLACMFLLSFDGYDDVRVRVLDEANVNQCGCGWCSRDLCVSRWWRALVHALVLRSTSTSGSLSTIASARAAVAGLLGRRRRPRCRRGTSCRSCPRSSPASPTGRSRGGLHVGRYELAVQLGLDLQLRLGEVEQRRQVAAVW